MRDLEQDACAVPVLGSAALTAAMLHVLEQCQRLTNDSMRFSSLDVCHKSHAACVFFIARII